MASSNDSVPGRHYNPRLVELIETLLEKHKFPADCRELATFLSNKGFEVSYSSLFAWKKGKQGISETKKRSFAKALGLNYEKFNAFLEDKIVMSELEEDSEPFIDEAAVIRWVKEADAGALLTIQKEITQRLIIHFDSEFSSLESLLEYAFRELIRTIAEERSEQGLRITQDEAFAIALQRFSESSGLKVAELEKLIENPKTNPTPKQIQGIAEAIGWEIEDLQELIDSSSS